MHDPNQYKDLTVKCNLLLSHLLDQECFMEQRNWVFATNFNFLIPISFQPDGLIACEISSLDFLILQNSQFEISKVYNIGLER